MCIYMSSVNIQRSNPEHAPQMDPLMIYRSTPKQNTSQNIFYAKGKRKATQVIIQAEPCLVFGLDLKYW